MVTDATPSPPDSLPNYFADGVPKQDTATLQDLQVYIDEVLEHRERLIEPEELPESSEPVGEAPEGRGTLVRERVRCGDDSCRCMSGGEKHGPYLYRYYRDGGRLKSEYVGKAGVEEGTAEEAV